jgi:uncharacterized protein
MDRRKFMATPMGLAACFLASNKVWGKVWDVDEDEAADQGAYEEKLPTGEYFVLDVQSHFTNGMPIGLRADIGKMEFFQNMGFKLKEDKEAYSFHNFIKEMFFDSETDMIVISGVPGIRVVAVKLVLRNWLTISPNKRTLPSIYCPHSP